MGLIHKEVFGTKAPETINNAFDTHLIDNDSQYDFHLHIYDVLGEAGINIIHKGHADVGNWYDEKTRTITLPENRSRVEEYIKLTQYLCVLAYIQDSLKRNQHHHLEMPEIQVESNKMALILLTPYQQVLERLEFYVDRKGLKLDLNHIDENKYSSMIRYTASDFEVTPELIKVALEQKIIPEELSSKES